MNLFGISASLALCLLAVVSGEDAKASRLSETAMLKLRAEKLVERVNSNQQLWTAEVYPKFAEMDMASKRRLMGVKKRAAAAVAEEKSGSLVETNVGGRTRPTRRPPPTSSTTTVATTTSGSDLPKNFDARQEWPECASVIADIQDQSRCGSCWAVAAASAMSDRLCIHSNAQDKTPLSAADIMSCEMESSGCDGGYPDAAWQWYHDHGVVSGTNYTLKGLCKPYPFAPHTKKDCVAPRCKAQCQDGYDKKYAYDKKFAKSFTSWMHADPEDIMTEIFDNGPVEADFLVYEDFMYYKQGVYKHDPDSEFLGGHAVRMIGWGEEEQGKGKPAVPYWLIANSWNYDWGIDGTFKMLRGKDECRIESWGINFGEPDLEHKGQ